MLVGTPWGSPDVFSEHEAIGLLFRDAWVGGTAPNLGPAQTKHGYSSHSLAQEQMIVHQVCSGESSGSPLNTVSSKDCSHIPMHACHIEVPPDLGSSRQILHLAIDLFRKTQTAIPAWLTSEPPFLCVSFLILGFLSMAGRKG